MKATKIVRWGLVASLSTSLLLLAACGGVSDIGSGDEPGLGKAGSDGTTTGGSKGMGANGTGANANGATSMGANGNVAGKDPGVGGATPIDICMTDADCPNPGSPCEPCADGTYACNRTYCAAGGKCITERDMCTTKCATDKDCPVPKIACADCGDGSTSCPTSQCLMGQCQTSYPGCAMAARRPVEPRALDCAVSSLSVKSLWLS